jgi:hypothetical protein
MGPAGSRADAADLLGCRRDATAPEVKAAYRRALLAARPDTGWADADWLARVQAARDLLLHDSCGDRRRRGRGSAAPQAYVALRRTTWQPAEPPPRAIDLRL